MHIDLLLLIKDHNNYNETFVAGATFTGTVLAIFFTLTALPIENILSKYSQDLIKRLAKDWVYIGSFLFLICTFIYNMIMIAVGSTTPELVLLSMGLTIDAALVLALLVLHTFYILDVRNQLNDITSGIKGKIIGKVRESEGKRKRDFTKFMKFINQK